MAFPLETAQLRGQQRSYALASSDKGLSSILRIVKPLDLGPFVSDYSKLPELRPNSPPIPFELSNPGASDNLHPLSNTHKRSSSRITNRAYHARRKSKALGPKRKSHIESTPSNYETISPQMISMPLESIDVSDDDVAERKEHKNPISKLFTRGERLQKYLSDSDSGSSVGSMPNDSTNSFPDNAEAEYESYNAEDASSQKESENSTGGVLTLEFDGESDEDLNEDMSVDSAFTDIEADSLADSSVNIMYDYTVPDTYVLERDPGVKGPIKQPSDKVSSSQTKGHSAVTPTDSMSKLAFSKLTPTLKRKESFTFQKTYNALSQVPNLKSNLSDMIQMRDKSSNINPLSYFTFVTANSENAKQAKIDLFVPPKSKPVLKDLEVDTDVSVFDCIGYCLLRLFEAKEFSEERDQATIMNPNQWRMELIDEDGDLYDSNFGTLDRTRLLSSYNFPRYLALCKAKNSKEASAQEKQTPLPLELKQNLGVFEKCSQERLRADEGQSDNLDPINRWNSIGSNIEVKVSNIPNSSSTKRISFFVSSSMQVGGLLDLICRQYQVDMSRYKLVLVVEEPNAHPWNMDAEFNRQRAPLDNSELLSNINSTDFIMVAQNPTRSMLDPKPKNESLEVDITPSSAPFLQSGITPKTAETGLKFNENDTHSNANSSQEVQEKKPPVGLKPKTFIENFISGANQLLPMNLNTIYHKWKVYRKKSPLLNRIEKSLILDGDYIHLAPTDDANWKKQPNDNPFSSSTQDSSHHHHHYLHHYNYSKYYNDTMLKTSSFHISRITKLKQYKDSKTPTHFKIVIEKETEQGGKESVIKKKYDLEAETVAQCEEIIEKINWALQAYKLSNAQ